MRTLNSITRGKKSKHNSANPHSPWQKMIEQAREEHGITLDQLAKDSGICKSTLYARLTANAGAPPRHKYSKDDNTRLARALKLKPKALADAYDQSVIDATAFTPEKEDDKKISKLRTLIKNWPTGEIPKEVIKDLLD